MILGRVSHVCSEWGSFDGNGSAQIILFLHHEPGVALPDGLCLLLRTGAPDDGARVIVLGKSSANVLIFVCRSILTISMKSEASRSRLGPVINVSCYEPWPTRRIIRLNKLDRGDWKAIDSLMSALLSANCHHDVSTQ